MIDIVSSAASRQSSIDRSARQRSQNVVMAIRSFLDGPAQEHRPCQRADVPPKRSTLRKDSSGTRPSGRHRHGPASNKCDEKFTPVSTERRLDVNDLRCSPEVGLTEEPEASLPEADFDGRLAGRAA